MTTWQKMINYIPRIFKEDLYILGKTSTNRRKALLYVSTLTDNFPMIYMVLLCTSTNHVIAVEQSNVLWKELDLSDVKPRLCSSVLCALAEKYDNTERSSGDSELVKFFKASKSLQPGASRIDILQEMLRLKFFRDINKGATTGQRFYSVDNSSHFKRLIGDYQAELAMTFGRLLPLPKDILEDPEHDELVGRILELFMQSCKKLNYLIDRRHPVDEEISNKTINYTFGRCNKTLLVFQYLMNPFISIKL